jgi:peptidoglycan/LPS O-acetylase OafA/YrhL
VGVPVGPPVITRTPRGPPISGVPGGRSRASAVRPARAASPSETASLAHRADIQGLRAVAVLLVVVAHAGIGFVSGGFIGVEVFFVVSGFLITGLLLSEARRSGSVSLLGFYVRRARRILPAATLTLVATDIVAYVLVNFVRAHETVDDSLHAAGFAANFHFATSGLDYFAQGEPPSPLLHYWSLSVEEQFYFVWPLLLSLTLFGMAWILGRTARSHERRLLSVIGTLTALSLGYSVYLTATSPITAYYSPFTRAWELGLGAILAVATAALTRLPGPVKVVLGWFGIAAIAVAAIVFSDSTPFPGTAALLPTLGTACAIVAGMGDRISRLGIGRWLGLRPMSVIGDRSYAFYLWHWPVLILAAAYAGHALSLTVKFELVAGAFLLSCVSYALVENPIRRRVRSRSSTVAVVLVCAGVFAGTAAVSLAGIDREQRRFQGPIPAQTGPLGIHGPTSTANGALSTVIAAVRAARHGAPFTSPLTPAIDHLNAFPAPYALPPKCLAHNSSAAIASKICRLGDRSSKKLIVLVGDSHAYMWLPAVLEMAWHDHLAVVPLLRLGCTPANWPAGHGNGKCADWFRWALGRIKRLHPNVVLLGGSIDQTRGPAIATEVAGVVGAARELHRLVRVVVIGDPEGVRFDPVDCLLRPGATMDTCTTTWPASALVGYNQVKQRVTRHGIGFLATRGFVSYERQYPAVIGHTIVWLDGNHMTYLYSAQVAGAFRAAYFRATLLHH